MWGSLVVAMVVAMAVPAAGAGASQMRQRVRKGARRQESPEGKESRWETCSRGAHALACSMSCG